MQSPAFIFVRSLALGIVLLALWSWFVPRAVGFGLRPDFAWTQFRTLGGIAIAALGFTVWVWCLIYFAFQGRGTLVPIDAPRHLVVGGPYRYVRNPMYLGVAVFLAGEAIALSELTLDVLIYFGCLAMVASLFVRFYEEPTLRKMFGSEYDRYRAHVRGWLPSWRRWAAEEKPSPSPDH